MLLSEAIRLGSMSTEKCTGQLVRADGARCALGAAAFAVGLMEPKDYTEITARWPWLQGRVDGSNLPEDLRDWFEREDDPIMQIDPVKAIWRLNDSAEWSREQIADWVATIEPPEPEPEPEVVAIEPKATEAA